MKKRSICGSVMSVEVTSIFTSIICSGQGKRICVPLPGFFYSYCGGWVDWIVMQKVFVQYCQGCVRFDDHLWSLNGFVENWPILNVVYGPRSTIRLPTIHLSKLKTYSYEYFWLGPMNVVKPMFCDGVKVALFERYCRYPGSIGGSARRTKLSFTRVAERNRAQKTRGWVGSRAETSLKFLSNLFRKRCVIINLKPLSDVPFLEGWRALVWPLLWTQCCVFLRDDATIVARKQNLQLKSHRKFSLSPWKLERQCPWLLSCCEHAISVRSWIQACVAHLFLYEGKMTGSVCV